MLALCSDKPLYKQRTYLIDRQKKRATCADLFSNFFQIIHRNNELYSHSRVIYNSFFLWYFENIFLLESGTQKQKKSVKMPQRSGFQAVPHHTRLAQHRHILAQFTLPICAGVCQACATIIHCRSMFSNNFLHSQKYTDACAPSLSRSAMAASARGRSPA